MEKIELLDNEINSFMGKVPSRIIRYGTSIFFVLALGLICASAFFKYPNVLKTKIFIQSFDSPRVGLKSNGKFIGKIELSSSQVSKVRIGQKVIMKLVKYPSVEYGILDGEVSFISSVKRSFRQDSYYVAQVNLPNGLVSSFRKEIQFDGCLEGEAQIILSEESLLRRVFFPLQIP